ncbi:MAG: fimbria/pilus outer membrane usher protein, partial [Candidatus Delongbacteria bacterium]|nr:fimbria/pilus outer membrane usher protein [Candidatus Delongbacteria bacterium]
TLFKEVFGYEQKKPFKLVVPFFINGSSIGKIEVFLKKSGEQIHVRKKVLLGKLESFLDKEIFEQIVSETLKLSTVSILYLEKYGIYSDYNEKLLEFRLNIPPELRKAKISNLGYNNAPKNIEYAIAPNKFSSYLNIRTDQNIQYSNIELSEIKRDPLNIHLDGAININKIVLESVGDYAEGNRYKIGKTCLVYDQPQQMLRYYLGDINIPIIGYQTSPSVGGISITKDFNLQPYSTTKPISMNEIIIYRPSTIEVYSNDILVEKLIVEPGPFNLRQVSFNHGINNVEVIVQDDLGEVQKIDIDAFYNAQQLRKGLNQYSFNLGLSSYYEDNMYVYDEKDPVLSFYYRKGLNNRITLGAYSQTKLDQMLFGIGSNFSTKIGNFD